MKTKLLSTLAALALGATGAAADPWNGAYVGGNAGVAFLEGDFDLAVGAVDTTFNSDTGFTFGGQAGYNFQHGDFVFGVEGDFNYLDVEKSDGPPGATTGFFEFDSDWFATIRGRAGMLMDGTLFYGTGGIALLDSDLFVQSIVAAAPGPSASDSDVLFGFVIGGGVEHEFSPDWTAKVEYLYMNFESHSVTAGTVTARAEPELHVIRVGINWHF